MADENPVALLSFEKNLTIASAIEGTNLRKLEKSIGDVQTITAICYLLNRFNSNFNVGKSITTAQSAIIASDILDKYPYETIEDIVLMLKMVRQGIIGDGKDYKLDGQNILAKWLPEYLDRKYAELERQHENQKKGIDAAAIDQNNAVAQFYAKQRAEKARKEQEQKVRAEIDEMVKSMDRQMLEDTIADWEKKPEMKPHLDYLKIKRTTIKK